MLAFKQALDHVVELCKAYQKEIDKRELWYEEPYQHQYLAINKLIRFHLDERLNLEALAAGEQSAPGFPSLTPARRQYYALEEKVPPFLASGNDSYYYLQTYRIATTWLLKTFSYSTFKGDWEKSRNLITWLAAIEGKHEKHNVSGSVDNSLSDIKDLGDLSDLSNGELRALEEEVRNIQALLMDHPELEGQLTAEELQLLAMASEHLDDKQDVLQGLPKVDNRFKYEAPPAIDVLAYRCRQLTVLSDDFPDDYDANQLVSHLDVFKQDLRDSFNLHVYACSDVYHSIVKEMGAFKQVTLGQLCRMLHDGLMRFTDEKSLNSYYEGQIAASHLEVQRGMPDTIDLEILLLTAIGEF